MWVEHRFKELSLKKEVGSGTRLFLCDGKGGYLSIPSQQASRYDGFFHFDDDGLEMYKILEPPFQGFSEMICEALSNRAETEKAHYTLPKGTSSLIIVPKREASSDVPLLFDMRKSYDTKVWGRIYSVSAERRDGNKDTSRITIKFSKRTDYREDNTHDKEEYSLFAVIRHDGEHELLDEWVKQDYTADAARGSMPYERHAYLPVRLKGASRIVVSASKTLAKAVEEADRVFASDSKGEFGHDDNRSFVSISEEKDKVFAYSLALKALDDLRGRGGLMAGYPWFFQRWTRDEAVSCGGLISQGRHDEAKRMLFHQLEHILPDGRIANQLPSGGIGSADANGWCFYRISQLLDAGKLSKMEKTFFVAKVDYVLSKIHNEFLKDDLLFCREKETWMDTDANGADSRAGARIEIQALQLAFYKMLYQITKQEDFVEVAKGMKGRIKEEFFDGRILKDGLDDPTIRPNIFIAYYVYPDLLTADEWKTVFDNSIPSLWLDWGGLSTIDKSHGLFKGYHTGEDNRSYHRGDSWYWINNLAAICMHRLDKERYADKIAKIVEASTADILWQGYIGSSSEISSALSQEPHGCLSQAWSLGTYVELMHELAKDHN